MILLADFSAECRRRNFFVQRVWDGFNHGTRDSVPLMHHHKHFLQLTPSCSDILLGAHNMYGHNEDGGFDDRGFMFLQDTIYPSSPLIASYLSLLNTTWLLQSRGDFNPSPSSRTPPQSRAMHSASMILASQSPATRSSRET